LSEVTSNARPGSMGNQRRSQRIILSVPVVISGKHANGVPFSEDTTTMVVNAHGALILLREPVIVGEVLRVTHVGTGEQLDCTVKDIDPGQDGKPEIGIEFAHPNPRFWRVSFPPVGWTPHSPEAKRFVKQSAPVANRPVVKK
jgi:hypothetical protein